ncbi:hypothetical protein [Ruixingdingia sedimenti]|uniref:Uncharacterized protein n=1 Tax=Ruixingdingia sedimenti TaxID=3073604 RepID=A0ABU1F389_9RHOB|nr:hypothetical protein [Xinfangfangia sp. LG-4]MDR5651312.1 hypothetical protein [Xinfangfangia sp. LG-4]
MSEQTPQHGSTPAPAPQQHQQQAGGPAPQQQAGAPATRFTDWAAI